MSSFVQDNGIKTIQASLCITIMSKEGSKQHQRSLFLYFVNKQLFYCIYRSCYSSWATFLIETFSSPSNYFTNTSGVGMATTIFYHSQSAHVLYSLIAFSFEIWFR